MHFSTIIQLGLLAASQVVAAPAEPAPRSSAVENLLDKRATPAAVTCGPASDQVSYSASAVQNSYNALVAGAALPTQQRPRAGGRYYPRKFGSPAPNEQSVQDALNAIPECATGQNGFKYMEFPLMDPAFTGGDQNSQGLDRVLAISGDNFQTFTYCLSFTHRGHTGQGDGAVDPCV